MRVSYDMRAALGFLLLLAADAPAAARDETLALPSHPLRGPHATAAAAACGPRDRPLTFGGADVLDWSALLCERQAQRLALRDARGWFADPEPVTWAVVEVEAHGTLRAVLLTRRRPDRRNLPDAEDRPCWLGVMLCALDDAPRCSAPVEVAASGACDLPPEPRVSFRAGALRVRRPRGALVLRFAAHD
jgi:hypothetical protein